MDRLFPWWNSLSASTRIAMVLMLGGAVVALSLAASNLQTPSHVETTPLMGGHDFNLEARESAMRAFKEARLSEYSMVGSKIMVPKAKEADYLGALASSKEGLPGGTDAAIDRYIQEQRSWWASTSESVRLFHIAEQRRVSQVIETFPEVDHATVLVSQPPERGTLRGAPAPSTAAVKVTTVDGKKLHPRRVEQIKQLVNGLFREITSPEQVEVVEDSLNSSGFGSGDSMLDPSLLGEGSSRYLMTKAAFQMQVENKIRELFADLRGLIVTVNAELDPRHSRSQRIDSKEKGPVKRETVESSNSEEVNASAASAGGEPGTRPNVDVPGAAPNQGAQAIANVPPSTETAETADREYDNIQTLSDQSFVDFEPVKVGIVVRYRIPPESTGDQKAEGPTVEQIKEMVASLGYPGVDLETVKVQSYVGEEPEEVPVPTESILAGVVRQLPPIGFGLLGLAAIVGALYLARRPASFELALAPPPVEPPPVSDDSAASADVSKDKLVIAQHEALMKINGLVKESPEIAASLVKRWLGDVE